MKMHFNKRKLKKNVPRLEWNHNLSFVSKWCDTYWMWDLDNNAGDDDDATDDNENENENNLWHLLKKAG